MLLSYCLSYFNSCELTYFRDWHNTFCFDFSNAKVIFHTDNQFDYYVFYKINEITNFLNLFFNFSSIINLFKFILKCSRFVYLTSPKNYPGSMNRTIQSCMVLLFPFKLLLLIKRVINLENNQKFISRSIRLKKNVKIK